MRITREQFRQVYKHSPQILVQEDIFYSKPSSDVDLIRNYLPSKLWRLNNVYKIVDKYGKRIKFEMNLSQHKVYAASLRHPRVIILKSRQQGISTLWLVSYFDDGITHKDFHIGLMAQGLDESSTLLDRTKILWEELDPNIKQLLNVKLDSDNSKEFSFSNGSRIFIRTSFRSTTLQRLHVSEMGKIANKAPEKAKEVKTGTLQAIAPGNIAVIESTAEGDNLFKTDYDTAAELNFEELTSRDFLAVFLSWIDDPDCIEERNQIITEKQQKYFDKIEAELEIELTQLQKNFWVAKYRELGDKIFQEYPSTAEEAFLATKDGTYYAHLWNEWVKKHNRVMEGLYDKNLDVQVSIDLGMNDTNSLTVGQTYMDENRFIDEFYDSGQKISYYTDWMKTRYWFHNLTHLILPHDAMVKELTSGKTRLEVFEEELPGVEITVLPKTESVNNDIEQVRQILEFSWFEKVLEYIPMCLKGYHKEYDEKRERFRDKPNHDEFSNGADSFRYWVLGRKKGGYNAVQHRTRRGGGMDI